MAGPPKAAAVKGLVCVLSNSYSFRRPRRGVGASVGATGAGAGGRVSRSLVHIPLAILLTDSPFAPDGTIASARRVAQYPDSAVIDSLSSGGNHSGAGLSINVGRGGEGKRPGRQSWGFGGNSGVCGMGHLFRLLRYALTLPSKGLLCQLPLGPALSFISCCIPIASATLAASSPVTGFLSCA